MICEIATLLMTAGLCARETAKQAAPLDVIPRPAQMDVRPGRFTLTADTVIRVDRVTEESGRYLSSLLAPATGFKLAVVSKPRASDPRQDIVLLSSPKDPRMGDEGYSLTVEPGMVRVQANTSAGAFYACQTLRQLLPPVIDSSSRIHGTAWEIPCVKVFDTPRFEWRGGLLDSARHFWDTTFIKRFIDLLAMHKLNRFHWHLTDDQGWRVQIDSFPNLTKIGAWRNQYGKSYGGYYSKKDLRDIVRYAKSRHVMVIPEIEMPGHTRAALAAYPELSCTGVSQPVATKWGVFEDIYCAGSERVYKFLESVLEEVVEIFPAPYVHVGGDECPRKRWEGCVRCQERIKRENLKDEHALHGHFMSKIEAILRRRGRALIAWDEILEGGLPPDALVQSWRGMRGGVTAAAAGHQVIMSPTSHCYLDYDYKTISLHQAYTFEPTFGISANDQKERILGIEGNMWTEHTPSAEDVERQVFPRLTALAEVGWSSAETRNWPCFSQRLGTFLRRLDYLKVNYQR